MPPTASRWGYGAFGAVNNNTIIGNQWDVQCPNFPNCDPSWIQWVATAVLVYVAGDVSINHNQISGAGTDIGVAAYYSGVVNVMNNVVERTLPAEDVVDDYGIGVDFYGNAGKSKVVNNTFSGWTDAYLGEDLSNNNVVSP